MWHEINNILPRELIYLKVLSSEFMFQLIIAGFTLFIWKNLRFAEDVMFYPKNELIAFPKIKIKWD